VAIALFVVAVAYPTGTLVWTCAGEHAAVGFSILWSPRLLGLLWRTLWMASAATFLSLLLSVPIVALSGRQLSPGLRLGSMALLGATLLCTPMVYAFGWQQILPQQMPPGLRCIWTWSLWAWPVHAIILSAGWRQRGVASLEAALLETSPLRAWRHTILHAMSPSIGLSVCVVSVLLFSEYSVPHTCGLAVYATELLSWASQSTRATDSLIPALWSLLITAMFLAIALRFWRRHCVSQEQLIRKNTSRASGMGWITAAAVVLLLSWPIPIGSLAMRLGSVAEFRDAVAVYGGDVGASLGIGILAGVGVVTIGVGMIGLRGTRHIALCWSLLFGALPGALIGVALVHGYNHTLTGWMYDHWPILVVAYTARFGWIGLAAALIIKPKQADRLVEQAQIDGASGGQILRYLIIPMRTSLLLGVVLVVAALSLGDVAASSLVRVPDFSPVAHIIIEKFHRFEDGMLISLSLIIAAISLPGAILMAMAFRHEPD